MPNGFLHDPSYKLFWFTEQSSLTTAHLEDYLRDEGVAHDREVAELFQRAHEVTQALTREASALFERRERGPGSAS